MWMRMANDRIAEKARTLKDEMMGTISSLQQINNFIARYANSKTLSLSKEGRAESSSTWLLKMHRGACDEHGNARSSHKKIKKRWIDTEVLKMKN